MALSDPFSTTEESARQSLGTLGTGLETLGLGIAKQRQQNLEKQKQLSVFKQLGLLTPQGTLDVEKAKTIPGLNVDLGGGVEIKSPTSSAANIFNTNVPTTQPISSNPTQEEKDNFLNSLPKEDAYIIKGLTDYSLDPNQFRGSKGATMAAKYESLAKMYDPTFDMKEYPARASLKKDISSGKYSKNVVSLNTLIGHLDSLKKSFSELGNTDIPMVNYLKNIGSEQTGSGAPARVKTDASAVAAEAANVFKGTGATDQEIKSWAGKINSSMSPKQQQSVINEIVSLMKSRLDAVDSQYTNVMGKSRDFSILNNKSKKILQNLGISPSGLDIGTKEEQKEDFSKMSDEELRRIAGGR